VCEDIFAEPVDCACIAGADSSENPTGFSEDAMEMVPESYLVPIDEALTSKKRKRMLLDVDRLSSSQLPETLVFQHAELADRLFKDLNFVRSYFKTTHITFLNEVTEIIRTMMMAHDSETYNNQRFYCDLSSNLLTDSVSKLNRKIKDGLVGALGLPQLQSKKRKRRSRGFFNDDDYNEIERAKDINTNILGLGKQNQPSRAERGSSFTSRFSPEGKGSYAPWSSGKGGKGGKGKGGKGKGGKGKGR
jgi:hypothetical protein